MLEIYAYGIDEKTMEFAKRWNYKILKKKIHTWSDFGGLELPEVRGEKKKPVKIAGFLHLVFQSIATNISSFKKILI
jgi:hypothetical protein